MRQPRQGSQQLATREQSASLFFSWQKITNNDDSVIYYLALNVWLCCVCCVVFLVRWKRYGCLVVCDRQYSIVNASKKKLDPASSRERDALVSKLEN